MKNKQFNELAVCGFEAVKSLGRHNPHLITRFYYSENRKTDFSLLCKELAERKRPYNMVEQVDLEKLSGSTHHEGVVAMISKPLIHDVTFPLLQNLVHEKKSILILDRISNANNFGAIVRSCAFFGLKTIIISTDDAQSSITTATYRIAKGGMDFLKIYKAESINRLLSDLQGFFVRIGTDVHTSNSLHNLHETITAGDFTDLPYAIILGNEERGISETVKNACDVLVKIPGHQIDESGIESLNVAQAASILLYELYK